MTNRVFVNFDDFVYETFKRFIAIGEQVSILEIGSKEWKAIIRKGAIELGVIVDDDAMHGFSLHAAEMIKFNRKMNLTAIIDPFEIAVKHVIDSLAAAPYISDKGTLLDIGSGAGFPGIPLKLVHPALMVTLIDGSARKISFLKHVIRLLNIDDIVARQSRAEQMGKNRKGRFDIVTTRALGTLDKCVQLALPLINEEKGTVIALRGRMNEDELPSLRRQINRHTGYRQSEKVKYDVTVRHFSLPLSNDQRTIVTIHYR